MLSLSYFRKLLKLQNFRQYISSLYDNFDWLNPAIFVFNAIFLSLQVFLSYRGMMRGQLQVRSKASIVTWSKSFTINCNYPASTQNRNITKSSPELVNNLHLHSIKTQKKGDAFVSHSVEKHEIYPHLKNISWKRLAMEFS